MSARPARLLTALVLGACFIAPAFATSHHHTKSHHVTKSKSHGATLIWRGDVTTGHGVVTEMAQLWEREGHGRIELQPFNTASGIDAVASGSADLAGSARPSDRSAEDGNLTFTPVVWDGLVMVTNASNPVHNLTVRQLHEIYYGKITNWSQVGGRNAPIDLVSVFSPNDGVEYSLRSLLFGRGDAQISAPRLYLNTKALEEGIALNPNGLGLSTLSNVIGNPKLRMIPIDGVKPTMANIDNGSYPLFTPLYLVTNPKSSKAAETKAFLDFLQGDKAKTVLREHSVLPYQDGGALIAMDASRRKQLLAEADGQSSKTYTPDRSSVPASATMNTANRTAAASTPVTDTPAAAASSKTYTVTKGDTLSGIAKKQGVSVTDLRLWNHIKKNEIKLGQVLRVSGN